MKFPSPITLKDAAELLDCRYVGSEDHVITGCNEIHMVEPGDLTFVDVKKYFNKSLTSAATTILINEEVAPPEGKGLLISDDPFRDYNLLTDHFQPEIPLDELGARIVGANFRVGEHVVVGENVHVGDGSQIGHNVVIGSHVRIGKNCRIHANVTIYAHTVIGDDVTINSGTVIGSEAFYFKARPVGRDKLLSKGRVVIEDHVDIGANCTIDRGVSGDTVIGEWTKFDNLVQIGHDTVIGKRCLLAAQVGVAGVVTIENDVILWGQVGVNKDLTIGKGAVLLGKTGVMSDLEGGKTYLGMIAHDVRQRLREEHAMRQLPDVLKKLEEGF